MTTNELKAMQQSAGENRRDTIRECVTWLALNCNTYRPEYLAGEMARDLLGEHAKGEAK